MHVIWFIFFIFFYAGWKSLHIPIAITKLSGLNVFIYIYIIRGRCRTITFSSNHIPQPEDYDRLSYLPVNVRTLYCNFFSVVNETWGTLTALCLTLHQHCLSSCHWLPSDLSVCVFMCFGGGVTFAGGGGGGGGGSYAFKVQNRLPYF